MGYTENSTSSTKNNFDAGILNATVYNKPYYCTLNIGGKNYVFYIDTGSALSIIYNAEILTNNSAIHSKIYNELSMDYYSFNEIFIDRFVVRETVFIAEDRMLSKKYFNDQPFDGVLGLNILQHFIVSIDNIIGKISFSQTSTEIDNEFPMAIDLDGFPFLVIDGKLGAQVGKWIIDTGNSGYYILNRESVLKDERNLKISEFTGQINPLIYNMKMEATALGITDKCKIGNELLIDQKFRIVSFEESGLTKDWNMTRFLGLIPRKFFENAIVTMDFIQSKLSIQRNKPLNTNYLAYPEYFGIDIDYTLIQSKYWKIIGVLENSPLFLSGLRVGDYLYARNQPFFDFINNTLKPAIEENQYGKIMGLPVSVQIKRGNIEEIIHFEFQDPLHKFLND